MGRVCGSGVWVGCCGLVVVFAARCHHANGVWQGFKQVFGEQVFASDGTLWRTPVRCQPFRDTLPTKPLFDRAHFPTEQGQYEQVFDSGGEHPYDAGMTDVHKTTRPSSAPLTARQRGILECIEASMATRGFPPSVREIGEAVGLTSPSTVHNHLNSLQKMGFLERDPNLPRAIKVCWDRNSGAKIERARVHHVPLVGDVAAGTDVLAQQNVEDLLPLPADFTGDGELFMLRVRGESMIDAGILDGDYVVARQQASADNGDIVVAGIPGDEATVKTFSRRGHTIVLKPANERLAPMEFSADDVRIFGKVVTVLRRL